MKRLLLLLPLVAFLTGCSNDIKVESDVGEISIVKDSAVTSYVFDKDNAIATTEKLIKQYENLMEDCKSIESLRTSSSSCFDTYGWSLFENEINETRIPEMPDITIVQYRTVNTDVNGDKTASGYKYVACIPSEGGSVDERMRWFEIIQNIDGINTEPKKKIENNLLDDGKVVSSVKIKVCEKYGNI